MLFLEKSNEGSTNEKKIRRKQNMMVNFKNLHLIKFLN